MPWERTEPMKQRIEFALRAIAEGENFRALCTEYGIAPKTGYKWKERFLARGIEGMKEESRRPKRSPEALEEWQVCAMVRIKERHRHWGPKKIREIYRREHGEAPSESSFKRVLERAGMVEKRRVRKAAEGGRISSGKQATGPNEVWTVDFKGWWHDPEGARCEPLTIRDEFSRYLLGCERMEDAKTETVWKRFERLFERHGVPGAIRSDNGSPFASSRSVLGLSRLSARWVALGIDLERGRAGCPQDNGAHERMHLDMMRELQRAKAASSAAALEVWRQEFNCERPHEALGMKCPAEVYENSRQSYKGVPERLEYEGMERRRVMKGGRVVWAGQPVFISSALVGWDLGLRPCAADRWEIYFASLRLGELEPSTASFMAAPWRGHEEAPEADKVLP